MIQTFDRDAIDRVGASQVMNDTALNFDATKVVKQICNNFAMFVLR